MSKNSLVYYERFIFKNWGTQTHAFFVKEAAWELKIELLVIFELYRFTPRNIFVTIQAIRLIDILGSEVFKLKNDFLIISCWRPGKFHFQRTC